MQAVLALTTDNERHAGPELVTTVAVPPSAPEQLPLIRILEIVRERVDSIHAGQKVVAAALKEIRENLPLQRRPLSRRTQELHLRVTWTRRNGLCPCCQETPVCDATARVDGAEFDHWFCRSKNRITQTWLVCSDCNQRLTDTDFKAAARSAFESYQQAIRPFVGRQLQLNLNASEGKKDAV